MPIVCITHNSLFSPINTAWIPVQSVLGEGFCPADQMQFSCLHSVFGRLGYSQISHTQQEDNEQKRSGEDAEGRSGFIRAAKFCLRTSYQNCAQAHSLAQEALQLLRFSTSFVDIPSKVAEVLTFVENVPRGPIRWTELKPKTTNAPAGFRPVEFLLFIIQTAYEDFGLQIIFYKNIIVEVRNGGLCSGYEWCSTALSWSCWKAACKWILTESEAIADV